MVTVTFHRQDTAFTLEMHGHAGAAPRGEDLVCCAASTLVYTAVQGALKLYESGMLASFPETALQPGAARVAAMATPEGLIRVEQMFCTVLAGFELLVQQYPAYIRFGD